MKRLIWVCAVLCSLQISCAQASLLITPTHIKFEERDRVKEVILLNSGSQTRTYKIEWMEQIQNDNGSYRKLNESELVSFPKASDFLRVSPRRVKLEPGEKQIVKLLLRRTSDMSSNEYRSHLSFIALPPKKPEQTGPVNGVSLQMDMLLNYTIPVLVATKSIEKPSASIKSVVFQPAKNGAKQGNILVNFNKEFGVSLRGDITVSFAENGSSNYEPVGYLNGVNMFHEVTNATRLIAWSQNVTPTQGNLKVIYDTAGHQKRQVIAEAVVPLN